MALLLLVGIGIIAGVNLIIYPSAVSIQALGSYAQPASPASIREDMVDQGGFLASTTVESPVAADQSAISLSDASADRVTATAYLVGNAVTGKTYMSSNIGAALPVASMSKLLTAIVATDMFSPTTTIEITPADTEVASDTSDLIAGEHFTLRELLEPLLLSSSNMAAEAIAGTVVGSSSPTASSSAKARYSFLEDMSQTAWKIGMPQAYFADPSGLDSHNQASAKDMFVLAQYLYKYRPDILDITRTAHAELATTSEHGSHEIDSTHPFVNDPRFIGGKTGRTFAAGETMLTILDIDDQPIVFIVLHSKYGYRALDTDILIQRYLQSI
jgi:serine-type D-Ala-D-Ala endopeptidase (penicillin-binding protein 7)